MIQQETYGLAAGARGGQQHQSYLPVVVLCASRLPDGSFQTTRTVAEIAGMAFVTIQNSDADPVIVGQRFVALQLIVDVVNSPPQSRCIHQGVDPPDAVGAAYGLAEPVAEEAGVSCEFQSIEATHASPKQRSDGFDDESGRDAR
jgi:hypothetical protein